MICDRAPIIDLDAVRDALTARATLDYYGWSYRRSGDEYESTACPDRADHSRRALLVNQRTGRWRCFPCSTSGDLFDFVAGVERLSIDREFPAVLARAAEIAGVGPSSLTAEERRIAAAQSRARRAAEAQFLAAQRAARDRAAVPRATGYWSTLPAEHGRGLEYLTERGLAAAAALVRFDLRHGGSPAIPLRSSSGQIRNVVRRRLPELGEPKTPGLKDCPTAGTLLGCIRAISSRAPVIVTEGLADTLTAALAWPDAVVLGAHGAGNLPTVVRVAAPAVVRHGTRLLLVPHNDRAGRGASVDAGRAAVEAGLSISGGTMAVIRHGEKDLNDAWRHGWRP